MHKLLYYCQGHHLAHFDERCSLRRVMAWDMGPVVAQLWKAEKDGHVPPTPRPLEELRVNVFDWIFTRTSDPYADARRVPGFADYWQAAIPSSEHFDDHVERCVVVCLFWLDVSARSVRCDRFGSLSLPVG